MSREHDDRLNEEEVRGLYGHGQRAMERVRAARAYLDSSRGNEERAAVGFMEIFHPNASEEVKRAVREAGRENDRRRR